MKLDPSGKYLGIRIAFGKYSERVELYAGWIWNDLVVHIDDSVYNLDSIARKSDTALNIIRRFGSYHLIAVTGPLEHYHIAMVRVFEGRQLKIRYVIFSERDVIRAFRAVNEFINEQKVADEQRALHGTRRNPISFDDKSLEKQGGDYYENQPLN